MTPTQIEMKDYRYFAGNEWRKAEDDQFFEVHEPYSGQPVVVVEAVDTPEDAIAAANRTLYGLTSSILAGNTYKAFEMEPKVLAGIVNVNSPTVNDEIHA